MIILSATLLESICFVLEMEKIIEMINIAKSLFLSFQAQISNKIIKKSNYNYFYQAKFESDIKSLIRKKKNVFLDKIFNKLKGNKLIIK